MTVHCRTVRSSAALALGKLSALSSRVDPLVSDLLSSLQVLFSSLYCIYFCFKCLVFFTLFDVVGLIV